MKNIKNYTSVVPAEQSILNIESILIQMGAKNIAKEYSNGKVDSIMFSIKQKDTMVAFKLPARVDSIKKLFIQAIKGTPSDTQRKRCEQQAQRTAWKNIKDWVDLQATMITLEQVEFMEIFMPYAYSMTEGKTFFERVKAGEFKQLMQ